MDIYLQLSHLSTIFKGPLLSLIPEISELLTHPSPLNLNIYKNYLKKFLLQIQSRDDEWFTNNFLLCNIPGLRRAPQRRARHELSYQEYKFKVELNLNKGSFTNDVVGGGFQIMMADDGGGFFLPKTTSFFTTIFYNN